MITLDSDAKIFIHNGHIDLRKAIDGLIMLVIDNMQQDPQARAIYLFYNKAKDKIKCIFWDGDGFILLYKRRESGKFMFPKNVLSDHYEIDTDLFEWLRKGFDFYALKHHPELKLSRYF